MITGAARAEAALLVIDAAEGVQENSRRHGYMVSLLGIRQLAVVVNKMDLVGWDRGVFERIVKEYGAFLDQVGIQPACFIPVSARGGDNIAERSDHLSWYQGPRCWRRSTHSAASRRRSTGRSGCRCRTSTSSPSRATTGASWPGPSTPVRSTSATRSSSIPRARRAGSRASKRSTGRLRPRPKRGYGRRASRSRSRSTSPGERWRRWSPSLALR